ncbi:hypothetical protein LPJ66_004365 [Kickxella alabastrina]|uniref:Uncharacterized protein n=1 Tax=Kickxella alabastrina TaxID=61397 RepID=A0ACC1ILI3_9FUNG|nr:hypothetical protein LPJ66_004365 [Kickxella alabastrina]
MSTSRGRPAGRPPTTESATGRFVVRPAGNQFEKPYGTVGRRMQVVSNYVEVARYPKGEIYQYNIELKPERGAFTRLPPPAYTRAIFEQAMRMHRNSTLKGIPMVYDARKIAYAPKQVCEPGQTLTLDVTHTEDGRSEKFVIEIRQSAVVSANLLTEFMRGSKGVEIADIQPILNAFDLTIGSVIHAEMVGFGRSFFTRTQSKATSGGLELWRGFSFSFRPGVDQLYLNTNTAVTAMYTPGSLLEALVKMLNLRDINQLRGKIAPEMVHVIGAYLRGVTLYIHHRGMQGRRKLTSKGITRLPLDQESFDWEDPNNAGASENITISKYYSKRYNITLRYPFLPGLAGRKNAVFPIELCEIADNQRYRGKLDERQTADMVTFACQRPSNNMDQIVQVLDKLDLGNSPVVKSFGLAIPNVLSRIESRVLPAPTLKYGEASRPPLVTPVGGAWNMRDKSVLTGGTPLKYWGVLILANRNMLPEGKVHSFVTSLVNMCNQTGYQVQEARPVIMYGNLSANIGNEMGRVYKAIKPPPQQLPQLLLVVLPTTNTQVYQTVKNCAYTTLGIHTQCMQAKHMQRPNPQYCANLCLKINVKMGGTNQGLPAADLQNMLHRKPTLFMGCDVTHPAPGEQYKPSIAAVVGSTDFAGLRYAATLIQLPSRQELVSLLRETVVRHLKLFFKGTHTKPQHIIFYRDGVSETQFNQVRDHELLEIQRACATLEAGYKPQITFVAVLKRHNTRFFPLGRDGDRTGNCVPGTVVDRSITIPTMFDFYLFAHGAIQGTSRPTHYYVLHNDAHFTADQIQQLTYHLCYTYSICTRSVSIVPPVYYAHRVADRARCHLVDFGTGFEEAASSGYYSAATTRAAAPTDSNMVTRIITIHERLANSAYFM